MIVKLRLQQMTYNDHEVTVVIIVIPSPQNQYLRFCLKFNLSFFKFQCILNQLIKVELKGDIDVLA